jgi:signal transduction histidine kinase
VQYDPAHHAIVVQDTGIGIDKATCDALFRAVPPGSRPGTGLGLLLVKELTKTNGGQLAIESQKDGGTTITLSFSADSWLPADTRPDNQIGRFSVIFDR